MALDCELNKDVDVMWYHNEAEVKPSKMVAIKAEGKRRTLVIKKVGDKDKGQYLCDCGTDKTTAVLHIEGKDTESPSVSGPASPPKSLVPLFFAVSAHITSSLVPFKNGGNTRQEEDGLDL